MGKAGLLDVIEAAYDLDAPEADWGQAIVQSAIRAFPGAQGALGFRYRLVDGAPVLTAGVLGDTAFLDVPGEGHEEVDPVQIQKAYTAASHAEPTTVFHADPRTGAVPAGLRAMWSRHGLSDMFGVYANRAGHDSMTIGLALPRVTYPTIDARDWRGARKQWGCVARHLELALGVRESFAAGEVAAEFDEHGHGDFQGSAVDCRAQLVETARRVEHERRRASSGEDDGLSVWDALLRGRWSIVRHRREGGRLRFLAVENPPGDVLRVLSPLEQAVIQRAAAGEPNKVIASELDIHVSSAASILARAMRKLGIDRRVYVAQLASVLRAQR